MTRAESKASATVVFGFDMETDIGSWTPFWNGLLKGTPRILKLLDKARYPRVYVKISHTWSISKQDYPWRDAHDLVKRVYHAFGAERITWGTDWPVCLRWTTYAQTLSVVRDEMDFFTPQDREWVLGKTALKLWPFETAAQ